MQAGKIPSVPVSTESGGNSPTYPQGVNRNDPSVCAATDRVCRIPEDIWDAPDGMIGIGFDDGPTPVSSYRWASKERGGAMYMRIRRNPSTDNAPRTEELVLMRQPFAGFPDTLYLPQAAAAEGDALHDRR